MTCVYQKLSRQISIMLHKNLTHLIHSLSKRPDKLALVEAVTVRRTGKEYVLTLVGKPPYEGESGVSTSKGVIFDCEFGGKKGRIVVKCEPENPAVTKEELDKAIKQAADYLENELKAGRKPRRRYRLNNGQMFRP
jgi:hypothetical protein